MSASAGRELLRRARRRLPPLLAALLLVGLVGPLAAARPVAAAGGDSYVTGATTYLLVPEEASVQVTVDMTFEDTKPDTGVVRYYFTGYSLALQREAENVRVTRAGAALSTTITSADGYLKLDVQFGTRVSYKQATSWRITYQLPDTGPRTNGNIRVSSAFAAFYAWAYGSDAASVKVVVPAGFEVTTEGGPLQQASGPNGTVLTAAEVPNPDHWFAWATASRRSSFSHDALALPVGSGSAALEVDAFPDDPVWRASVTTELRQALPALGQLVGLAWPVKGTLKVSEAFAPVLGGYAGFFAQSGAPGADEIRITEDPDPLVIAHEVSHAWFNEDLFDSRWIDEGLANEYAARTRQVLGDSSHGPEAVDRADPVAFALVAWPPPSRISDQLSSDRERYGYNASWQVIHQLVDEVGLVRMQRVLAAAAARQVAYVGRPAPETRPGSGGLDWRAFLDLLEQMGGSSTADALFSRWVVSDGEASALVAHQAAVDAYARLVARGRGWLPGYVVRGPLDAWQFDAAGTAMTAADAVLHQRDQIGALATRLDVEPSDTLQATYEQAASDLQAAERLAADELTTLEAIDRAQGAAGARDLFTTIGLIGGRPEDGLAAAASDFHQDRLAEARADAAAVVALLHDAPGLGQQRLAIVVGLALLLLLLLLLLLALVRIRRRRRAASAAAAAATLPAIPEAADVGPADEGTSQETTGS